MSKEKPDKNKSVYVITRLELDGDGSTDVDIGYVDTEEEAQEIVETLKAEIDKTSKQWEKYCSGCDCGYEAYESKDCQGVKDFLETIQRANCPFAKDVEIKEIFYGSGDNKESGGFEAVCKHQVMQYDSNYTFTYSELKKFER